MNKWLKEELEPIKTGKVRVCLNVYDFRYYIEEEYSDFEWLVNEDAPAFPSIENAQAWFQRAKEMRKQVPADLGSWND